MAPYTTRPGWAEARSRHRRYGFVKIRGCVLGEFEQRGRSLSKGDLLAFIGLRGIEAVIRYRRRGGEASADAQERMLRAAIPYLRAYLRALGNPRELVDVACDFARPLLPKIPPERVTAMVHELRYARRLKAEALGNFIGLTAHERTTLDITTIRATGMSDEAMRAERRRRNRERMKKGRAKKQEDEGRSSVQPAGPTLEDLEPWTDLNISRATFFRRFEKAEREAIRLATIAIRLLTIEAVRLARAQQEGELRSPDQGLGAHNQISRQHNGETAIVIADGPAAHRITRLLPEVAAVARSGRAPAAHPRNAQDESWFDRGAAAAPKGAAATPAAPAGRNRGSLELGAPARVTPLALAGRGGGVSRLDREKVVSDADPHGGRLTVAAGRGGVA